MVSRNAVQRGLLLLAVMIVAGTGFPLTAKAGFVEPAGWSVGDSLSTYQQWDHFSSTSGAEPDVGWNVAGATLTKSTFSVEPPALLAGSGNYYSFGGDYGIQADVSNHTTATGTDLGTHVIVQTAASLGSQGEAVMPFTLKIRKGDGSYLAGGYNSAKLQHAVLSEGIDSGPFGPITVREEMWEFWLPNYVGDFRVVADVQIHGSLRELRIDSKIASGAPFALTEVPEPSSLLLFCSLAGVGVVLARRRIRHRHRSDSSESTI